MISLDQNTLIIIILLLFIFGLFAGLFLCVKNGRYRKVLKEELGGIQNLQKKMIPTGVVNLGHISLGGFYRSLSYAGGDLWGFKATDDRAIFWIGDVTGHGAPAAMITSAVRSALSVAIRNDKITIDELASIINDIVLDVGGKELLMSFFIASVNEDKQQMSWINAGHPAPCIFRQKNKDNGVKAFDFLDRISGPLFGVQKGHCYRIHKSEIGPTDQIIFYTDGIIEESMKDARPSGDRPFFKKMAEILQEELPLNTSLKEMEKRLVPIGNKKNQKDDLTLFIAKIN